MRCLFIRLSVLAAFGLFLTGCATPGSIHQETTNVRLSYSPITAPPLSAKGRMLIRPFTDHHAGNVRVIPGGDEAVLIAPDQSLAQTVSKGFAEASCFAGYQVRVAIQAPAGFRPDVVVEGDIRDCDLSVDRFAGMKVSTHHLAVRVRIEKPGNPTPQWQGIITSSSGNFPGLKAVDRKVAYEAMLSDSLNAAMLQWAVTLDPAAATELKNQPQQQLVDGKVQLSVR